MFDGYFPVCLANRDGDARLLWHLLASDWERSAASAIEAAVAGETTEIGSTVGESAVAKPDAQGPSQ